MINSKILGYTIKSLIGKGGMAEVYYAENTLGRAAAIKVLHESLLSQTEVKVRFENEARIMVSLDHPNIGKVYDVTEYNGRPAIIMEYLEGNTLSQALSKNQLTPGKLFDLFDQASQGLRYAHKKGVVHRDIKPSNLFLTTAGQLKILDFGIAKLEAYESHTLTGQTLGTMLYMSHEQVRYIKICQHALEYINFKLEKLGPSYDKEIESIDLQELYKMSKTPNRKDLRLINHEDMQGARGPHNLSD